MENLRRAVNQIANTSPSKRLETLSAAQLSLIPLLYLASSLYSLALPIRHHLYRSNILTRHRLPVPVISVGNLTWGGNGKTPMVEFLARVLIGVGVSPLILTRGYCGADEAKMLQRHLEGTKARIGVGADRVAIAANCFEKYGHTFFQGNYLSKGSRSNGNVNFVSKLNQIGAAILDDGMQHLRLCRDLEIVMINAMMPWGNDCLLPLGPLREPLRALGRADVVILHHADLVQEQDLKALELMVLRVKESVPVFSTEMSPLHFFKYGDASSKIPVEVVENMTLLCITGIGFTCSFVQSVKRMRPRHLDLLEFNDHHLFQIKDMNVVKARLQALESQFATKPCAVITEKDYDRAPEIFTHLQPYGVLVLCCCMRMLPRNGETEDSFKKIIMELLYQDGDD